ncbi:MAG: TetR family transcriptional regulator C-terminal domain-containing protein [Solirubrobacterales bacterium]
MLAGLAGRVLLEERQDERIEHMRATVSPATDGQALDRALVHEARDAIRSLKDSREWRLLVLEFIAYAVRTPNLAPKLKANERKLRDALTEVMQQQIDVHGITPSLPPAEFALGVIALAEGLAVQELTDPGTVRDDLLPDLLTLLLPHR